MGIGQIVIGVGLILGILDMSEGDLPMGRVSQREPRAVEYQFFLPGGETRPLEVGIRCQGEVAKVVKSDPKGRVLLSLPSEGEPLCDVEVEGQRNRFDAFAGRVRWSKGLDLYPIFLPPPAGRADEKTVAQQPMQGAEEEVPLEARRWVESAQRKQAAGETGAAISDLARALRLFPRYAGALNQLGLLFFRENRFREAVQAFGQGVGIGGIGGALSLNLGVGLQRLGLHTEAVKVLSDLVKADRTMGRARVALADSLMQIQQWDAAVDVLQEVLQTSLGPELEAETRYLLAQTMMREERYRSAVRELEHALRLVPNWAAAPLAELLLGKAQLSLGHEEAAEAALRRALEKGGTVVVEGRLLLAQLFLRQKKLDAAEKMLEEYSRVAGRAASATEVAELLRQIRAGRM